MKYVEFDAIVYAALAYFVSQWNSLMEQLALHLRPGGLLEELEAPRKMLRSR